VPDISALDAAVVTDINAPMRQRMETYVKLLQHRIVSTLGAEETGDKGFFVDSWLRKEGGEGISCVLQDGQTFEKAGVNISIVHGNLPPRAIAQMSADHAGLVEKVGYNLGLGSSADAAEVRGLPFYATGLSLVVHPRNPSAPTVHFNYRYFELTHPEKLADGSPNPRFDPAQPDKPVAWWFGGGTDLTPMVLFPEDAEHFHSVLKKTADRHDPALYPAWKRWCDRYFWIPHRGEARGVGGIFFDDLTIPPGGSSARLLLSEGKPNPADTTPERPLPTQREHTKETLFAVVRSLGDAFLPAYLPLLQRRKNAASTPALQRWQALRRGRYVEFNLVYDRGTKFGLQTPGARIESILMSLPLHARFEYLERHSGVGQVGEQDEPDEDPKQAQRERDTMRVLRRPHDWVR
jgi:coproporphyrinogen III oxidase